MDEELMEEDEEYETTSDRKRNGTLFIIGEYVVRCNTHQYILQSSLGNSYYARLGDVIEDVFEDKLKLNLVINKDKTVQGVQKTIDKTTKWVNKNFGELI